MVLFNLFFYSCQNESKLSKATYFDSNKWQKIEIPLGKNAYAIFGDIDDTLVVSTFYSVFFSVDNAVSWKESYKFNGAVNQFLEKNDTLYALLGRDWKNREVSSAGICSYFSLNKGVTWKPINNSKQISITGLVGFVQSKTGVQYRLLDNYIGLNGDLNTLYASNSDIERKINNVWTKIDPPTFNKFYNLHLDKKNRLYIAGTSYELDKKSKILTGSKLNNPAIVYISKKPFPK